MKIFKFIISFLFVINFYSYSLNFTTGKSVAFYGANASVCDGFDALLYNPAGLFMTDSDYGFNFLGSYGIRYYSNSITSDELLDFFIVMKQGRNLSRSGVINEMLTFIPDYGFDFGANASVGNIMVYKNFKNFGIGFSFVPKTEVTIFGTKSLFHSFLEKLDLTKKLSFETKLVALQYLDLNISLSTRAKLLEKKLKAVDKIYIGLNQHFYFPTLFLKSNSQFTMKDAGPNDEGVIDKYKVNMNTDLIVAGYGIGILNSIPFFKEKYNKLFENKTGSGFGIGYDMGFIVEFNNYVKIGFSITDLGFIIFPTAVHASVDNSQELELDSIGAIGDSIINGMIGKVEDDDEIEEKTEIWMPGTAIRVGISVDPLKNKKGFLTIMNDISICDFNRILNGSYPTFSISTGLELKPKYKKFAAPLRIAYNYNTQANIGALSLGLGLYFGVVHLDFGIKGLEILIYDLGAREFCCAFDLTFIF